MDTRRIISFIIILIIGIIAYANSFGNEFIWEDRQLIIDNPYIKNFGNVWHIFNKGFFENDEGFNFYRPFALFFNMVDYSIWKLNPFGYHLTNFILHFVGACFIYSLLFYFFNHYGISLFLSLIFIIHPSATEAITYIPGRADPLAFVFLLISFLLFIKFLQTNQKKVLYYIFSLSSFVLACLSKEIAIIFPTFLVVYKIWQNKNKKVRIGNNIIITLPYLLIASGAILLRHIVLRSAGNLPVNQSILSLFIRVINFPLIILRYILMFTLPRPFVFDQPIIFYPSIFNLSILAALVSSIITVVLIIRFYKSKIALGAMWFFTFIFPVSGIIPINAFLYHHWLYIPSLGFLIIIGDIIIKLNRISKGRYFHKIIFKYGLPVIGIAILFLFIKLTIKQNCYFKDELTFYTETIKKSPKSSRMYYNLGLVYIEKGQIKKAISEFKKAIEVRPDYVEAYVNLGYAYQKQNLIAEAEKVFKEAITIKFDSYLPYYYLANLYNDTGRFSESIELYKKSISLKEKNPNIYFDLGRAYDKNGNIEFAVRAYQKTIELDPTYIDAYINLGVIFAQKGQFDKARLTWGKGLKFDPTNLDIKRNLEKLKKLQR